MLGLFLGLIKILKGIYTSWSQRKFTNFCVLWDIVIPAHINEIVT